MKKFSYFISILLFIVLLSGCRKDQQNKLVGYWEQIPFYNPDSTPIKTYWQFYAGDAVTIFHINGDETDSLQYTFNISGSVLDIFSGIDDPTYSPNARDPRGQYWVDYLKGDQLKATKRKHPDGTTDAVYMRIELVKR